MSGSTAAISREQLFLQNLRSATATMHHNLEQTRLSQDLMRADLSLQRYATYLMHMRNVMTAYESILNRAAHLFPKIQYQSKLPLINEDLQYLSSLVDLPAASNYNMPVFDTEAHVLGCMYVIEGSALGGRMILNHIKNVIGFDEQNGARFFAGAGDKTGMLWKYFLGILTAYVVEHDCEEQVICGAQVTFAAICDYFA